VPYSLSHRDHRIGKETYIGLKLFWAENLRIVVNPSKVQFSIQEQILLRNVQRFRGGLVFKAHRLLYHSTLDLRVIKKKKT